MKRCPIEKIAGAARTPAASPRPLSFLARITIGRDRPRCSAEEPLLRSVGPHQEAACHFSDEVAGWVTVEFPSLDAAKQSQPADDTAYAPADKAAP